MTSDDNMGRPAVVERDEQRLVVTGTGTDRKVGQQGEGERRARSLITTFQP